MLSGRESKHHYFKKKKKKGGGNLLQLYLQKDFRFQKLGITGRRFPTISDDHVYTLLSASF